MADFFEPGKTYIQAKPFQAPEALRVFHCTAVADHPAGHGMRAFGFMATAYPGDNWCSAVRQPRDWEQGWHEYDEPTANAHACENCDGVGPDSCLFNPVRGGAGA